MHPSRPHLHSTTLTTSGASGSLWEDGRGRLWPLLRADGLTRPVPCGRGAHPGSRVGLPSIPHPLRSAAKAQACFDRQTDGPQTKEGRKGGRPGGLAADAHMWGKPSPGADPPAGRLSEGDVHVPVGVDSARGGAESQLGLGTQHLDSGAPVRRAPHLPRSTSPRGTGQAQTCLQRHLVPVQPLAAATRTGPWGGSQLLTSPSTELRPPCL